MFDWNDEDLANIIWGEGGEGDDHTVPFPDGSEEKPPTLYADHVKKEWSLDSTNVWVSSEENFTSKNDMPINKVENSSKYGEVEGLPANGFVIDSWQDASLPNASKSEDGSIAAERSNIHDEISKGDSSRDDTAQLDIGSETFQGPEDKDGGDFVEYDWANIGSFDDLDRIFNNDDPIFGNNSMSNTDELWSSSKDLANSPEKTTPLSIGSKSLGLGGLKSLSGQLQVKTEYELVPDQTFAPALEKINDGASNAPQNSQASLDHVDFAGGKSKLLGKEKISMEMVEKDPAFNPQLPADTVVLPNENAEKAHRQKRSTNDRKRSGEKMESRRLQEFYGGWPLINQFQQFEGQYTVAIGQPCSSPLVSQRKQIRGSFPSPYKLHPGPLLSACMYENMANQFLAMSVPPHIHSSEDAHTKPQIMTPQEKIEKLRRRQQMRAMLAIQKQQQQLTHQGFCSEASDGQKFLRKNKMLHMTGGNAEVEENLSVLPAFDPSSPIEQDDSSTVSASMDDSVENAILFRLQEIVAKLDVRIRLCIRDSLFRLAQSAMQRQSASDTDSTNKTNRDDILTREESHKRFNKGVDSETDTNPIDRSIAHLLFHGSLDLPGKLPETPDSSVSAKLPFQRKSAGSMSIPLAEMPESSDQKQSLSNPETTVPLLFPTAGHPKNDPSIETSDNA